MAQRLREVAGQQALPPGQPLDTSDPRQVDAAARSLLAKFYAENDPAAFRLLVELTQELLAAAAHAITRDVGLAVDPLDLVGAHMGRVLCDLRQPPPDVEFFLDAAQKAMTADAEQRVAAIASSVPFAAEPAAASVALFTDIKQRLGDRFTAAMNVAFHRLDEGERRILIAREVDRLSYTEIAGRLGIEVDQVAEKLYSARHALSARLAQVAALPDPPKGEQP